MKYFAEIGRENLEFDTFFVDDERIIQQNGKKIDFDLEELGTGRYSLIKNNKSYILHLIEIKGELYVHVLGQFFPVHVDDEREKALKELVKSTKTGPSEVEIKAPIPGLVVQISVKEGDKVQKGDALLILEAMKMENIIKSPGQFKVQKISAGQGDAVQQEQTLVQLVAVEE